VDERPPKEFKLFSPLWTRIKIAIVVVYVTMRRLLSLLLTWNHSSSLVHFTRSSFTPANNFLHRGVRQFLSTKETNPLLMFQAMMKLDSPSAQRNKQPIWEVLSTKVLPRLETSTESKKLRILEVAAGSGVHTEYLALALCDAVGKEAIRWYPTDPQPDSLNSIQCYIDDNASTLSEIVAPPMSLTLDSSGIIEPATQNELFPSDDAAASSLDLIICINMIHISPWEATLGLMKMAGKSLSKNGCLYCYGPYKIGGTGVESNLYVETTLKS
jgi:hypothetical protein